MKLARIKEKTGRISHGIIEGSSVSIISGSFFSEWERTGEKFQLTEVDLLAPVVPCSILAIGRNYKEHAAEGKSELPKEPALFIKAISSVADPLAPIVLPKVAPNEVDYEAELAVVIKKSAKKVTEAEALDYVLGYTCANDVSARDCQRNDVQWARGKSFDTFAPLGPWMETDLDPQSCAISCRVNGQVKQNSSTSLMVFSVPYIISYLSQGMTLPAGTVILTGTPAGCGFAQTPPLWLRDGDLVEVEISGIGVLKNPVIKEK